jgi:hypothetical protein
MDMPIFFSENPVRNGSIILAVFITGFFLHITLVGLKQGFSDLETFFSILSFGVFTYGFAYIGTCLFCKYRGYEIVKNKRGSKNGNPYDGYMTMYMIMISAFLIFLQQLKICSKNNYNFLGVDICNLGPWVIVILILFSLVHPFILFLRDKKRPKKKSNIRRKNNP